MSRLSDILNFLPLDPDLACAGQPGPGDFQALADEGFVAVLNLATAASTGHLPEEPELCARAGMDFHWIPVPWDSPQVAHYLRFQDWLDANRERKVLVHCAKNWRATVFCALYRILREGVSRRVAWDDVLEVWEPNPTWNALFEAVLKQVRPALSPIGCSH